MAGRLPGVHLNDNGKKQAQALAEVLQHAPIKNVYASPLERTFETAEPIAQALGLKVIPEPGLLELDVGDWQDKTLKQLRRRKLWKTVQHAPSRMRFPNGETFANAQQRIAETIEALSSKHKPQDLIVCVSHSDIIKLAVSYYLGQPLDLFQRLVVAPASISTLHIAESWTRVVNINHAASIAFPHNHPKSSPKKKD